MSNAFSNYPHYLHISKSIHIYYIILFLSCKYIYIIIFLPTTSPNPQYISFLISQCIILSHFPYLTESRESRMRKWERLHCWRKKVNLHVLLPCLESLAKWRKTCSKSCKSNLLNKFWSWSVKIYLERENVAIWFLELQYYGIVVISVELVCWLIYIHTYIYIECFSALLVAFVLGFYHIYTW